MSEEPRQVAPDRTPDESHQQTHPPRPVHSGQSARPPMPRWVKVLLVIVLVIAAALLISSALGLEHGPGMHGASTNGALPDGLTTVAVSSSHQL